MSVARVANPAAPGARACRVQLTSRALNRRSCLHCLGELEAAKAYYQQSIECLERERAETPVAKKVLNGFLYPDQLLLGAIFGTAHDNRIRMTKERLVDIAFGRTPDLKM